jgi:hypothetical protein
MKHWYHLNNYINLLKFSFLSHALDLDSSLIHCTPVSTKKFMLHHLKTNLSAMQKNCIPNFITVNIKYELDICLKYCFGYIDA